MKKKRSHLGLLGTLLILSPSLMAVSEYSETNSGYADFNVTVIDEKDDSENEEYSLYDLKIQNTGRGYLLAIRYDEGDKRKTDFRLEDDTSPVTNSILLRPSDEFIYANFRWFKESEFPKGSFTGTAYDRHSFDIEENISVLVKDEERNDLYHFTCNLPTLNEDYGYNYVATLEYDGSEYCIGVSYHKERFSIATKNTDFDVNKAKITKVSAFYYTIYRPNYAGYALGGALYIFLVVYLPFIVIVSSIVITIAIVKRVRKKKRANNNPQ